MLFLFGPVLVASAQAQCWDATVLEVIDGNTLIVNRKQSATKIRLYGIDAPATSQAFASEAKKTLQGLVLNKKITACLKKKPANPAYEVHVLKGFMLNVNREMIRKGLAWSTLDLYKTLEESARKKRRGLWSKDTPVSPKQYRQKAAAQQRVGVQAKPSGSLSVYKVNGLPKPAQAPDNATQAVDPAVMEQRQQELEAIRQKEQERVSDTRLSLTDIEEFKLSADFVDADYESYAGLEISFYYWSTALDSPVDWNDGDVNCECSVIGHFSEGTNTRIARKNVLLSSYRDRVYIDIPYSYLDDSFVELLSCTVECRLSAGIFDLKSSDKVYLQFTGRPWFYRRRYHY